MTDKPKSPQNNTTPFAHANANQTFLMRAPLDVRIASTLAIIDAQQRDSDTRARPKHRPGYGDAFDIEEFLGGADGFE